MKITNQISDKTKSIGRFDLIKIRCCCYYYYYLMMMMMTSTCVLDFKLKLKILYI